MKISKKSMTEKTKKYIIYGIVGAIGIGGIYYAYTISKKSNNNQNANTPVSNSIFVPENINANIPLVSNSTGNNTEIAGIKTITVGNINEPNRNRQLSKVNIIPNKFLNPLIDRLAKPPKIPTLINPSFNQPSIIAY